MTRKMMVSTFKGWTFWKALLLSKDLLQEFDPFLTGQIGQKTIV